MESTITRLSLTLSATLRAGTGKYGKRLAREYESDVDRNTYGVPFSRVNLVRATFFKGIRNGRGERDGTKCMKVTKTICDLVSKAKNPPPPPPIRVYRMADCMVVNDTRQPRKRYTHTHTYTYTCARVRRVIEIYVTINMESK